MLSSITIYLAAVLAVVVVGFSLIIRWGTRWGSTPEERALNLPGDGCLKDGPAVRVAMTRAISIAAEPQTVWPWLAQLGRGAGWCSIDWLDNGRKVSARHIVSWIPEPQLGDASPIGYLRHIEPGRALVWWVNGVQFCGACSRLVVDVRLTPEENGARLVIRVSADASGPMARVAMVVFQFIDSIMSRRQLLGIKERVERYGARTDAPEDPESGARDQYQLYEAIYASGATAGVRGKEHATKWRRSAIEDGVLAEEVGGK